MGVYKLRQLTKYICRAKHRRGFGVHSPFMFDFVTTVLRKKGDSKEAELKKIYKELIGNKKIIEIEDVGEPSKIFRTNKRKIGDILKNTGVGVKYGILLYRIVEKYKPQCVIELGTSLGFSAICMGKGEVCSELISIEGSSLLANEAVSNFRHYHIARGVVVNGKFEEELPLFLNDKRPTMFFIDGNHTYEGTLEYYHQILRNTRGRDVIIVFDDIHWSKEMTHAWNDIKTLCETIVTVDLFRMGVVFNRKGMQKQDYVVLF